ERAATAARRARIDHHEHRHEVEQDERGERHEHRDRDPVAPDRPTVVRLLPGTRVGIRRSVTLVVWVVRHAWLLAPAGAAAASRVGIEPTTKGLKVPCSTAELPARSGR